MRKFGVFSISIFIFILLSGVYGIVHDQVTYSISPEYFTKFKFQQFGFDPDWFGGHRETVAVIGFLATWWMGLVMGVPVSATALFFNHHKVMQKLIFRAIKIIFSTAVIFALIGFLWGKYHLVNTGVDWWLPASLVDKNNFIIVGSIHNFSYLGGIIGFLIAIVYMIIMRFRSTAARQ